MFVDHLPRFPLANDEPRVPGYLSPIIDRHGQPILQVWPEGGGAYFRHCYSDGVEFLLDRAGTRIWITGPPAATSEYIATYLLGPIMAFLLCLRGFTCLHASAVAVGRQAVAFLGPAGAGKSTTAAAFVQQCFPVLTDDVTVLKEEGETFFVLPSKSRLCLWPEAVELLFGSREALPWLVPANDLWPDWDKRRLDVGSADYPFQAQPLPLAAIYLLDQRTAEVEPVVEAVSGGDALLGLLANIYVDHSLDREMRAQEFRVLSRVVDRVAVRRVHLPSDPASLPRLVQGILKDFQSLTGTALTRLRHYS